MKNCRKILNIAILCLIIVIMSGCAKEEFLAPITHPDKPVSVSLEVPGFDIPVTRSIANEKGEAVIETVDILIFNEDGSPGQHQKITKNNITQSEVAPTYKAGFKVLLNENKDARTVVLVANAPNETDEAFENVNSKKDFLTKLQFKTLGGSYKWKTDEDDYTPIPMYGEIAVNGITGGMSLPVSTLKRMLARIDIQNEVEGSIFKLEEIYLVNYNTAGYIAPAWNVSTGIILQDSDTDYPYNSNKNPMIPTSPGKQPGDIQNAIKYNYIQENSVGDLMEGEIYTYEAVKGIGKENEDAQKTVCLILKGSYEGKANNFYRIDFTKKDENAKPGEVEYMSLYRNHKYIVTIVEAKGKGYSSFDDALKSKTVLSNLKTSIDVKDLGGYNNLVYNGQYFMGSVNENIEVVWGLNKKWNEPIVSNYEGSWTAEILDHPTWLKFAGGAITCSGTDISTKGLDFEATALTSYSNPTAQIRITAGRLVMLLTVKRVAITPLFARSNVVWVSGSNILSFAVSREDNAIIPSHSQGVFFKWGSLIALSPAGNPYDPTSHVVFNPSTNQHSGWSNKLSGWDNIPYAHSKFQFIPSGETGDDADAFYEYNTTGFYVDKGIGDVCRYISTTTDAKEKWVEGNWRMPTYKEFQILYSESRTKVNQGSFTNFTEDINNAVSNYRNGSYNPQSGWFVGVNANNASTSNPEEGTVYLPASGHRYPNGDGDVVHVGAYGYYWTSTPYDNITVNYPLLSGWSDIDFKTEFYDADRSYAFPVRCIRDK